MGLPSVEGERRIDMTFKAAMIQLDIVYKDPDKNLSKVKDLLKKAMKDKPDMIVLPETWTTGYSEEVFHSVEKYGEYENGKIVNSLKEMAFKNKVWIVGGSIVEKDENGIYNTIFLIDRNGEVKGKYRKMHLYSAMDEDIGFKNGMDMPVFDTEFGKISLMTCYDIRFVELSRTYALRGAEAIIVVSNFPNPKLNHWRVLLQARAIENQLYIIACNRVGSAGNSSYFGHSLIIDPWGNVLEEGDEEESILIGEVDFEKVKEVRNIIPMYYDRRPQSYPNDILKVEKEGSCAEKNNR
ncbi:carbon-nitrogen family hydrolase [Maledivibacter halophilus]|uniref:Carbon-nitrogen hydrolase n=1 Tax=Maledivibacter halophilus TaxID=36842 RepID=A0A1T5M688_9FIRM|nr:carbon-nitrogen family hydrolase [Maledivibacter halophilus]SKC83643.1 Carbon-nitrogen hydrolase [Maledivibacter halophilus]